MSEIDERNNELPNSERVIIQRLRSLIMTVAPKLQEKISNGVPYFFRHRRVCFPWRKTCGHFRDVLWPSFVQCAGVAAVGQSKASIRPSDPLA